MSYPDLECPYCGEWNEIDHDGGYGYEEDRPHLQGCSSCEKTFVYYTSISYHYEANKADCQNGGECRFVPMIITPKHWPDAVYCKDCGREKRGKFVPLEEKK